MTEPSKKKGSITDLASETFAAHIASLRSSPVGFVVDNLLGVIPLLPASVTAGIARIAAPGYAPAAAMTERKETEHFLKIIAAGKSAHLPSKTAIIKKQPLSAEQQARIAGILRARGQVARKILGKALIQRKEENLQRTFALSKGILHPKIMEKRAMKFNVSKTDIFGKEKPRKFNAGEKLFKELPPTIRAAAITPREFKLGKPTVAKDRRFANVR